ncbi:MAG TPA: molybdopterin cofactor-binding domain-containing protein [Cyclobacteriaceae bacterium]|jgi:xanthine dehydrogenase molybdopterin-binding subunit B|nr:molybdopterin cofactor-binding domain-containing protein [Cyclobacteriaceae bacterium]
MPKEKIHIKLARMGGGFGQRAYGHHLVEAAVISQKLNAPVKLVYSREDDMTYGIYRPTYTATYNPDWALVFEGDKKIYFVAETKETGTSSVDLYKLSADEQMKIKCGKAHFNEFDHLEYRVVSKVGQLMN